MSKKIKFVQFLEDNLFSQINYQNGLDPDIISYWEAFKLTDGEEKPMFTDNGKLILQCLQDHPHTDMWKAKDIADTLGISSRSVSGAIRKLVNDGYVEKLGQNPIIYKITDLGKNINLKGENE